MSHEIFKKIYIHLNIITLEKLKSCYLDKLIIIYKFIAFKFHKKLLEKVFLNYDNNNYVYFENNKYINYANYEILSNVLYLMDLLDKPKLEVYKILKKLKINKNLVMIIKLYYLNNDLTNHIFEFSEKNFNSKNFFINSQNKHNIIINNFMSILFTIKINLKYFYDIKNMMSKFLTKKQINNKYNYDYNEFIFNCVNNNNYLLSLSLTNQTKKNIIKNNLIFNQIANKKIIIKNDKIFKKESITEYYNFINDKFKKEFIIEDVNFVKVKKYQKNVKINKTINKKLMINKKKKSINNQIKRCRINKINETLNFMFDYDDDEYINYYDDDEDDEYLFLEHGLCSFYRIKYCY